MNDQGEENKSEGDRKVEKFIFVSEDKRDRIQEEEVASAEMKRDSRVSGSYGNMEVAIIKAGLGTD